MSCNDDACIHRGHPWCDTDTDENNDNQVCYFCGDSWCDGSGYNCDDGHYQEYNLRGWPEEQVSEP